MSRSGSFANKDFSTGRAPVNGLNTKINLNYTARSESRCALSLRYIHLVVSVEVAV
jgi:hypothetical protein